MTVNKTESVALADVVSAGLDTLGAAYPLQFGQAFGGSGGSGRLAKFKSLVTVLLQLDIDENRLNGVGDVVSAFNNLTTNTVFSGIFEVVHLRQAILTNSTVGSAGDDVVVEGHNIALDNLELYSGVTLYTDTVVPGE